MTVQVTNNGFSTLASGINNSVTTIALASGEGARFPTLTTGNYFYGTLIDTSNNLEIVKVTARSSDSLTVVRAQDNTSARAFSTGDRFELRPVAKLFEDIRTLAIEDRPRAQPIVVNGDMGVAQRGDQTGKTAESMTACDRFRFNIINLGTWSFTQSTDNPGNGFGNSLKIDCTTADASPAAGDNAYLSMQTEGRNLQGLLKGTSAAKTSTISYWIKSNKTGNYVAELWDRTNDRHVGKVVTISQANTWEKHVCNFPADTSGALAASNARSVMISWAFDAGSNFTSGTLPSAWQARVDANRFVGTTLALGDNTANEVLITGVQWEVGTFDANSIAPFQFEDGGASLARCQRYCSLIKADAATTRFAIGFNNSTSQAEGVVYLPVSMRAGPTLVTSGTASDYGLTVAGAIGTCSSVPIVGNQSQTNPYFQDVFFTQTSVTANNPVGLCGKTTDGFLRFEAEL